MIFLRQLEIVLRIRSLKLKISNQITLKYFKPKKWRIDITSVHHIDMIILPNEKKRLIPFLAQSVKWLLE